MFKSRRGRPVSLEFIMDEIAQILYNDPEVSDILADHPLREDNSRGIRIFKGLDQQRAPTDSSCPFAMIIGDDRTFGTQNGNMDTFTVICQLSIKSPEDGTDEFTDPDTGIITNKTSETAIKLGEHVIEALSQKACAAELAIGRMQIYDEFYPMFITELSLQFNTHKLIGSQQRM